MIGVTLDRPWLRADLGLAMRVLSFAPYRPGFVSARHVLWREVRNADLKPGFDAIDWLADAVAGQDAVQDAVAMLTSRDVGTYRLETAEQGLFRATCLATVGLSNAERVGTRLPVATQGHGTINLLVAITPGLTDTAMIEALSIAAEARTAAVMEAGLHLQTGLATGTGTDCIAIACPPGDIAYAGLHTAAGEVIGRAVHDAIAGGCAQWMATEGVNFGQRQDGLETP